MTIRHTINYTPPTSWSAGFVWTLLAAGISCSPVQADGETVADAPVGSNVVPSSPSQADLQTLDAEAARKPDANTGEIPLMAPAKPSEIAGASNPQDANQGVFTPPAPAAQDTSDAPDFPTNPGVFSTIPGTSLGGRPSGFTGNSDGFSMGGLLPTREGLSLSSSLTGEYESNPLMGIGSGLSGEKSGNGDFFLTLGGAAAYHTTAPHWTLGANYTGSYSDYFSLSQLSGFSQSGGVSLNYTGGPLSANFTASASLTHGANRYYGAVANELGYSYGLGARYTISPKTSLTANFSQSLSNPSSVGGTGNGSLSNTGSSSAGVSALWRYSALTEFGPGIHYTSTTGSATTGGNGQDSLTSIGPTLTVNYNLSSIMSFSSVTGLDFAKYQNGESAAPTSTESLALTYHASSLWGMNLSLYRGVQADPIQPGDFTEITSLRLGHTRKILKASLNIGVSYESDHTQAEKGGTAVRPDGSYLNFDTTLSMPVFEDKCTASVLFGYRVQSGGIVQVEGQPGDSWQTGFTITYRF